MSAKASWEIYCSGNEGRKTEKRRREEKDEVRDKWRRERIIWGGKGREGEEKERSREGREGGG